MFLRDKSVFSRLTIGAHANVSQIQLVGKRSAYVRQVDAREQRPRPPDREAQRDTEGMQMVARIIAGVVPIGLIWSVAVMSNLLPVDGSISAAISRPAK